MDDGRARVEIMRMAVKHVKVYGLLLLDNNFHGSIVLAQS